MDARSSALFRLIRSLWHGVLVANVDCNISHFTAPSTVASRYSVNSGSTISLEALAVENDAKTVGCCVQLRELFFR